MFAAAVSEAVGKRLEGVERGSQKSFIFMISEQRGRLIGVIIHKSGTPAEQSCKAEGQHETPLHPVPLYSSSSEVVSGVGLWR